jgi:Cdc6-like AAA superfamily ATPase
MAIDISRMQTVRATRPPRTLIYGPPGMGKTSLASEWPDPVFLQVEDGTPAGLELTSFGHLTTFDEVMGCVAALYNEDSDRKTVVLDSLDRLEPMVWQKTCSLRGWETIETPGYGKGYAESDQTWRELIEGLNALRYERGMNIVYVAHSTVVTIDDPMTQSYSRFDIRLHKRATAIFQDEVDAILFLNQDVVVKSETVKKGARTRADGGGNRWIYAAPRPAYVAKNRYGIADKIVFERGKGYKALAPSFPQPEEREKEKEQEQEEETNKAA